jgi:hypothetical protein
MSISWVFFTLQMPRASLANNICQILYLLKQLVLGKTRHGHWGQIMYDTINSLMIKLAMPLKRSRVIYAILLFQSFMLVHS